MLCSFLSSSLCAFVVQRATIPLARTAHSRNQEMARPASRTLPLSVWFIRLSRSWSLPWLQHQFWSRHSSYPPSLAQVAMWAAVLRQVIRVQTRLVQRNGLRSVLVLYSGCFFAWSLASLRACMNAWCWSCSWVSSWCPRGVLHSL